MTPHDHRTYVEGCYRCELGRDEVEAMPYSPAARPIWIDAKMIHEIAAFYRKNSGVGFVGDLIEAWDAAPADPTEAAAVAIAAQLASEGYHPDKDVDEHDLRLARAVLAALGHKDTP